MKKENLLTPDRAVRVILRYLADFVDDLIVRNLDHYEDLETASEQHMLLSSTASLQNVAQEINRLRTGK